MKFTVKKSLDSESNAMKSGEVLPEAMVRTGFVVVEIKLA